MKRFSPHSVEDEKNNKNIKKSLYQKWNAFFPRIQVKTCAQMHTRVKLLGGDADEDHTQIIGGNTVKLLGGYILPGFDTPGWERIENGR